MATMKGPYRAETATFMQNRKMIISEVTSSSRRIIATINPRLDMSHWRG